MDILKTFNTVAGENTYYLVNEQAVLVVDPGSDSDKIIDTLTKLGKPIAAILLTHTHYDHIMSLDVVREQFEQPPVYVAAEEADWITDNSLNGLARHEELPQLSLQPADHHFQYDTPYDMAGFHFSVVPTPGHSAGGVSFIFPAEELVITGDALFRGTIGRTDLPTGSLEQLLTSIKEQLFTLPDSYTVCPGHGMNTTIGQEKRFNPYFS